MLFLCGAGWRYGLVPPRTHHATLATFAPKENSIALSVRVGLVDLPERMPRAGGARRHPWAEFVLYCVLRRG
jgi:hypothetical protein